MELAIQLYIIIVNKFYCKLGKIIIIIIIVYRGCITGKWRQDWYIHVYIYSGDSMIPAYTHVVLCLAIQQERMVSQNM